MIERPEGGERAILVQLALPGMDSTHALAEFKELAISAHAEVIASVLGSRPTAKAKYFVGSGKASEIQELVAAHEADVVLVNHALSPSQERNLEQLLKCRVVDRSGLILDIFAQRARTFEGKLQVELAQLQHLSTRLVRGWTHLERQKGGIGLRGPGETQLETDRRLLRDRIQFINRRLEKVRLSRDQNRRARQKAAMPTVSLVGYTNAGKSTLFNRLTGEQSYAADQLFATLDPTMRKVDFSRGFSLILADTVGFISDLPHKLVDAFRATLEETVQSDLLLHVIDASDPRWRENERVVQEVLHDIGAGEIPVIQVFNKIDKLIDENLPREQEATECQVWLSAQSGLGLEVLTTTIMTHLQGAAQEEILLIEPHQGKLRAELYRLGAVLHETYDNEGRWLMTVKLTAQQKQRFLGIPIESHD